MYRRALRFAKLACLLCAGTGCAAQGYSTRFGNPTFEASAAMPIMSASFFPLPPAGPTRELQRIDAPSAPPLAVPITAVEYRQEERSRWERHKQAAADERRRFEQEARHDRRVRQAAEQRRYEADAYRAERERNAQQNAMRERAHQQRDAYQRAAAENTRRAREDRIARFSAAQAQDRAAREQKIAAQTAALNQERAARQRSKLAGLSRALQNGKRRD